MRIWTVIFVVAALFNFAVGLPMLLAPEAMLAALGQPVPADLLMTRLASLLIVVLGIGYGMVARDPAANRPILWLGVLGKAPIPLLVWISGGAADPDQQGNRRSGLRGAVPALSSGPSSPDRRLTAR
eukprot:gene7058-9512_t